MTAVAAMERSAALSGEPSARGERLIHAAQLAFELGRRDIVLRLLGQADAITQAPAVTGADGVDPGELY